MNKGDVWTCCKAIGPTAEACATGSHIHATWPEEEAKKYFIEKALVTDFRNE